MKTYSKTERNPMDNRTDLFELKQFLLRMDVDDI